MSYSADRNGIDTTRVLGELIRSINRLNDSIDGMGGKQNQAWRSGRDGDPRAMKDFYDGVSNANDAISQLNKNLSAQNKTTDKLLDAQDKAIKSVVNNEKLSIESQSKLLKKIEANIKAHSFLGESMKGIGKSLDKFEDRLEETSKFLNEYSDVIKEAGEDALEDIDVHQDLRKAIKKLNKEIIFSGETQELISKGEYRLAAKAIDREAKNAKLIRKNIHSTASSFKFLNSATGHLKGTITKTTELITNRVSKEASTLAGSFGLIAVGIKDTYQQFWQTASQGMGGAFFNLSVTAIKLGISLEALTKVAKENMNLVGKMGFKGFSNSLKETQVQLMALGLSTEEAVRARAAMNQNALLAGVEVKDRAALSTSIQQQISSYETLRAITGESIENLAAQTKILVENNDATKIMGSLSRLQRTQMLKSINLERTRLTQMGLTNDAASNVIKTFQALAGEKTTNRIEAGNKIMAAGSVLGIDHAVSEKMAAIMMKSKGARTSEDLAFMADYAKQVAAKQDSMYGAGASISTQMLGDLATEWTQPIQGAVDDMRAANLNRGLTNSEVETNKALGRVNPDFAELSQKIEVVGKMVESPLFKILAGVLGIGAILTKHVFGKKKPQEVETKSSNKAKSVQENSQYLKRSTNGASNIDWTGNGNSNSKNNSKKGGFKEFSERADRVRAKQTITRAEENNTSIASPELRRRLAENRARHSLDMAAKEKSKQGDISYSKGKARKNHREANMIKSGVSKGFGFAKSVGSAASGLAGKAAKLLPGIGIAITALSAISGAFDGVNKAAEIFGVDVTKTSLTTTQKVSAGIAGALNTLSFGFIPTDSTARVLNTAATMGGDMIVQYSQEAIEFVANKAIPMAYDGIKKLLGFAVDTVKSLFSFDTWKSLFVGDDGESGGLIGTILRGISKSVQFLGTALAKGAITVAADMVTGMIDLIPDWAGGGALKEKFAKLRADSENGGVMGFAAEDTKFSDFDTPGEAKSRAEREKRLRDFEAASKVDRTSGTPTAATTPAVTNNVVGTVTADATDMLGIATDFNTRLSEGQLRAQGIGASPGSVPQSTIAAPNSGIAYAASQGKDWNQMSMGEREMMAAKMAKEAAQQTEDPNTKTLNGILEQMTELVGISKEELSIIKGVGSTNARTQGMGDLRRTASYSPAVESFLNIPI